MRHCAALGVLLGAAAPGVSHGQAAQLVIDGAEVRTLDPARPTARAVVIAGGRVAFVGDEAEAARRIGPGTRVIHGRGRMTVLPGLIDGHAHLVGLGRSLGQLDLRGQTSPRAIADKVRAAPPGWVVGRGWDQNLFPGQGMPDRAALLALDSASSGRPVWLRRVDGHAGWANSETLRRAGIDDKTPDPAGGRILRDPEGRATGVLVDNAMDLVEAKLPAPDDEALAQAILRGARAATARGLTAVTEMGLSPAEIRVYGRLAAAGALPLRVFAFAADPIPAEVAARPGDAAARLGSPAYRDRLAALSQAVAALPQAARASFRVLGIKLFADGALGSRGAALLADYADEPGRRGLLLAPPEHLEAMSRWAVSQRWQIATHAIGDRGNRLALTAYERAAVHPDRRFRIEHAQVVDEADQRRFAALGVIASVQPTHATSDMPWAEARLGPARTRCCAYVWRRLLAAGARICAGSDFPVEEVDPLFGLHAAVTRQDARGRPAGGWYGAQRLTVDEALGAFTTGAAYAAFVEDEVGQLRPGLWGDLTVISGSLPASGAPTDLARRQVLLTVIGGQVVHDRLAP